jgi:hypothetical protein
VRSSIVRGAVGSKPVTVPFCKSTIMPMFITSEDLRALPVLPHSEIKVPWQASVVSAACAGTNPKVIIAMEAMPREQSSEPTDV